MPCSGLCKQQAYTWCTYRHASKTRTSRKERERVRDPGSQCLPLSLLPWEKHDSLLSRTFPSTGHTNPDPAGAIPKRKGSAPNPPPTKRPPGSPCQVPPLLSLLLPWAFHRVNRCFGTLSGDDNLEVVQLPVCTHCPVKKAVSTLHRSPDPGGLVQALGPLSTELAAQ